MEPSRCWLRPLICVHYCVTRLVQFVVSIAEMIRLKGTVVRVNFTHFTSCFERLAATVRHNPLSSILVVLGILYFGSSLIELPDPETKDPSSSEVKEEVLPIKRFQQKQPALERNALDDPQPEQQQNQPKPAAQIKQPARPDLRTANRRSERDQLPAVHNHDEEVPTSIDVRWLSEKLIRVALGPPVDKVPPALDDAVSGMLNWYSPNKRYMKYEWDL